MTRQNWLNLQSKLLVINVVLLSTSAYSETICDDKDPAKCAAPLEKGEKAPFSGQLFTPKLAIDLSIKADGCKDRIAIEKKHIEHKYQLELSYEKQLHSIDNDTANEQISFLKEQLKKAHKRSWYEHPAFIVSVTIIGCSLVFFGAAYGLDAIH